MICGRGGWYTELSLVMQYVRFFAVYFSSFQTKSFSDFDEKVFFENIKKYFGRPGQDSQLDMDKQTTFWGALPWAFIINHAPHDSQYLCSIS